MLKLYNTLTKTLEEFRPIKAGKVGIYSCGPTVYWNQHIGHMYAYVQWDILVRYLRFQGYQVEWVMNITDVGHLTSDEDTGEDKMEKGAAREGKTVWEIADKYIKQFTDSLEALNITLPDEMPRATEHIARQIELIKLMEQNGFTYRTQTGIVFDTSKFDKYADFANLDLDKQIAGSRVEVDPEKKNPRDFMLWVTNQPNHIMQWDSPWGRGFPGWHLECTAMSTQYLGNQFDIHTGGIEHIPVHHTNEIAQGYGAFGAQTANYWLHNGHLLIDDQKMSKSKGNMFTVQDLEAKGIDPLALRYLILNSHYKKGMNFTFAALESAANSLQNLRSIVLDLKTPHADERTRLSEDKLKIIDDFRERFTAALDSDLNVSQALAVLWEAVKSNIPSPDKLDLALLFDEVLGLKLAESHSQPIPSDIQALAAQRDQLRQAGDYQVADRLRQDLESRGFSVQDTPQGAKVIVRPAKNVQNH